MKSKEIYSESYKKGSSVPSDEVIERINRKGSRIEILKHAKLENGTEVISVQIYFNKI